MAILAPVDAILPLMPSDTTPAAEARYAELLRARAPHERLAIAMSLTRATRELSLAGLRARHPAASEEELRVRLAVRLYGRAVAERIYGDVPGDAV
jgi:hypothetical protein